MAKVQFAQLDPRVLPEMSAKVAFLARELAEGERTPRVAVRPSAVVQRDGRNVVFVIRSDKVAQVAVETGGKIGELLEIRAGVQAGDRVVLHPSDKLRDGIRITQPSK
jgi:hypothetical protein